MQYPRSVLRRSKLSWRVVLIWRCHGKLVMQQRLETSHHIVHVVFGTSFLIRRFPTFLPGI